MSMRTSNSARQAPSGPVQQNAVLGEGHCNVDLVVVVFAVVVAGAGAVVVVVGRLIQLRSRTHRRSDITFCFIDCKTLH